MVNPVISVVIPVRNDADRLRQCLEALSRQTYPRPQWEVVVSDNGSDRDNPAAIVAGYPFARLVREAKPGASAARNRALRECTGHYLAFTDADCLPAWDWLEKGAARLEALGGKGVLAGRITVFPRDPARPNMLELFDMAWAFDQAAFVTRGRFGATANLWADREGVLSIGGFREEIPYYGEDVDLCHRLQGIGRSLVYAPDVVVAHPARWEWAPFRARLERQVRAAYAHRPQGGLVGFRKLLADFRYDWFGYRDVWRALFRPEVSGVRNHWKLAAITAWVKILRHWTRWQMWREGKRAPR
jgi:glycosyltransferase involved in cell wall biosynthesis